MNETAQMAPVTDSTVIDHRDTEEVGRANQLPEIDPADAPPPEPENLSTRDAIAKAFDETTKAKPETEAKPDKAEKDVDSEKGVGKNEGKLDKRSAREDTSENVKVQDEGGKASKSNESGQQPEEDRDADSEYGGKRRPGFRDETEEEYRQRHTPPQGFVSPRAKELWVQTPTEVKREVHRLMEDVAREREQVAEVTREFEEVREYRDLAQQHGTTLRAALDNYVGIERLLHQNPVAGISQILSNIGVTLPQFVQYIASNPQVIQQAQQAQNAQQAPAQQQTSPEVAALRDEIESLKIQQAAATYIEPFRAANPRFDELQEDIAFFLNSGKIPSTVPPQDRLALAYEMAERLNPAPYSAQGDFGRGLDDDPASGVSQERPAENSGNLSVRGAPSGGKTTSGRTREFKSNREALIAAMRDGGLS